MVEEDFEDFKKYRWFYTKSGKLVVGGKSAEQNDLLLMALKDSETDFIAMHTTEPGSPFSVILTDMDKISKSDLEECAIFTGCFSRAWKEGKSKTSVDIFKISQVYKEAGMKEGTWAVRGKVERIAVPLQLALTKQKGILRAIPEKSVKSKKNILIRIKPGKIEKSDISAKIELELNDVFDQEELLSALPSGGISIFR